MTKVVDTEKQSKTLNEVRLVENISKNPQSFPFKYGQEEVCPSYKLQDHAYE